MKKETLELFIKNYENEGMCKNLPKFIKSFDKEFKKANTVKTINYYPWAVIERIFRMQGGNIVVENWAETVEFKSMDFAPNEHGELILQEQTNTALFIKLSAKWMDEELEEFYPLFDNQNAKVIKTPNALDLNTARQRGSVRLIARISGIGLDIFEQQDSQFEDDGTPQNDGEKIVIKDKKQEEKQEVKKEKAPSKTIVKKEKDKAKVEEALESIVDEAKEEKHEVKVDTPTSKEISQEPTETNGGFLSSFLNGDEVDPQETVKEIKKEAKDFKKEDFDNDSEEHANLLLDVRKVIRNGSHQTKAKEFVKTKGKELLSELSYTELQELEAELG